MTTTLEKKSPEIQTFVASLGIRIRRNTRDGVYEYRCSEHQEWQLLCVNAEKYDIERAIGELEKIEQARRAWPDRVMRVRAALEGIAVLNIEPTSRPNALGALSTFSPGGDVIAIKFRKHETRVQVLLIGEDPLEVRARHRVFDTVIEKAIERWGSDAVPEKEGGDG